MRSASGWSEMADDGTGRSDAAPPRVRDGVPDDLPVLLRIQAVSLPDPSPAFLRTGLRAGLVLVAEPLPGDGTADPVGYLLYTAGDRVVYAAEMAVTPAHRRRGHASRLLETLAARHADHDELRLTTRRSNDAALALYERLDFRVERRLPGHYEGGTDTEGTDSGESGRAGAADGVLLVRDL